MREIKFKVYDKDEKCFHYFTLANILQYRKEFEKHILDGDKFEQFTGLHDKNGKEIYEGDILKDYYDVTGIVIFENTCFKVDYKNYGKYCLSDREKHIIEIIGNIHENPEMIKEVE